MALARGVVGATFRKRYRYLLAPRALLRLCQECKAVSISDDRQIFGNGLVREVLKHFFRYEKITTRQVGRCLMEPELDIWSGIKLSVPLDDRRHNVETGVSEPCPVHVPR